MKEAVKTEKAPAAIGPYSQGVRAGETLYVSGQLPVNPETGAFAGEDIKAQARQSLENVRAVLNQSGMDMQNVVKSTVFLKNMEDFAEMNEVYASFFSEPYPARAAIEVARLPKDALVEIEVTAVK